MCQYMSQILQINPKKEERKLIDNSHMKRGAIQKFLTSTSPLSEIFNSGITGRARNERAI
jgi:hypothetical protein